MQQTIGLFSFFAGAGFLDLGFEKTGKFEALFVNEFHSPFLEIYQHARERMNIKPPRFGYSNTNITELLDENAIRKLNKNIQGVYRDHNLIGFIGGPPCPDFSIGGKNRGKEGENGVLSNTYIELICKLKPDFFLFENVKGLYRTQKHRVFFEMLKEKLIANGYYLTEKLVNALEYGVPQARERIILLGFKREVMEKSGFHLNGSPYLPDFKWNENGELDLKEILASNWPESEPFRHSKSRPVPEGNIRELTVEYWFKKNNVTRHPNSKHYFKPRAGLPKFQTIEEGDDSKKSYKRLHRWRYSPTAAYGNNEVHLHPYLPRRLTVAEALAIQSLPEEFEIKDGLNLTDMFKTVGNGVPFLMARGLASAIFEYLYPVSQKDGTAMDGLKETKVQSG